jgi:sporulation protein YlmC with PRC-barrel domain
MLTSESLQRRVVLSSDGVVVGTINKLFIRPDDWRISSFEVRLRKEVAERAGIAVRMFRAPTLTISADLVQSTGDAVILSVPLAALHTPAERKPVAPAPQPSR